MKPSFFMGGGSRASAATVSYQTNSSSTSAANVRNWGALAIGAAATGRVVVVHHGGSDGSPVSGQKTTGVTCGGTAMNLIVQSSYTASVDASGSLWWLRVDTGTTATIISTHDNAAQQQLSVWAVYDSISQGAPDYSSSVNSTDSFTADYSGAVLICAGKTDVLGACSWTGPTERYDVGVNSNQFSGADMSIVGFDMSFTATFSGGGNEKISVGVWY